MARAMSIRRIFLRDFRNHAALELAVSRHFVVATGPNGAGKTNILEALSLLAPGRGLRRAALSAMARSDGPGHFALAVRLGDVDLGTGTLPGAPERRQSSINGARGSTLALSEWVTLLWLTPAMDRLFAEPAAERRLFLDRLVSALIPAHAQACSRYDAARRERNRLLADDRPLVPAWLDALDLQLAEHGSVIASNRRTMIDALQPLAQRIDGGPFAAAQLALADAQLVHSDDLLDALQRGRAADRAAGRTLHGPHRSDLLVTHAGKRQPAALCSTGEQKALLLAILLGHAELVQEARAVPLILLLDEVAAHLDPDRRRMLFDRLRHLGSQIWLTGTEPMLFQDILAEADHITLPLGAAQ